MIAFVRGDFVDLSPAHVVVDVNGVGYYLHISLNTYSAISNMQHGQLLTYLHITENAQTLFGFADLVEKEMFLLLIGVSGIGAATARMMLSGMKPEEISKAIMQSNIVLLSTIKGIGKKTAERLVVELKDKFAKQPLSVSIDTKKTTGIDVDAVQALIALGINRQAAEQVIIKEIAKNTAVSLEELIKSALKNL